MEESKQSLHKQSINLSEVGMNDPTLYLQPSLIQGLLRRGEILAISAPRTSLKTSAAIQLAISVATGSEWLDWKCVEGKVLFVNINQDEASCINRFFNSYRNIGLDISKSAKNIEILTFDKGIEINKLKDELTSFLELNQFKLVVIDSIDNINSPSYFDKSNSIGDTLERITKLSRGATVFTQSHDHQPKGNKEARKLAKQSEVRKTSEVLLEFIELDLDPELLRRERIENVWEFVHESLTTHAPDYYKYNITDRYRSQKNASANDLRRHLELALNGVDGETSLQIIQEYDALDNRIKNRTYWRLEVVSNRLSPKDGEDYLFYYPLLEKDELRILEYHEPNTPLKQEYLRKSDDLFANDKKQEGVYTLISGIRDFNEKYNRNPTQKELADFLKLDRSTIYRRAKNSNGTVVLIAGVYEIM